MAPPTEAQHVPPIGKVAIITRTEESGSDRASRAFRNYERERATLENLFATAIKRIVSLS